MLFFKAQLPKESVKLADFDTVYSNVGDSLLTPCAIGILTTCPSPFVCYASITLKVIGGVWKKILESITIFDRNAMIGNWRRPISNKKFCSKSLNINKNSISFVFNGNKNYKIKKELRRKCSLEAQKYR